MTLGTTYFYTALLIIILLSNIRSYYLFYRDKKAARSNEWRVPERRLLRSSFLLGGIGSYAAMKSLRHKTQHKAFRRLVMLAALITVTAAGFLFYRLLIELL